MRATWTLLLGLELALAGCGSDPADARNCKDACDKLLACRFPPPGFPCDPNCSGPEDVCARCIVERSCADLIDHDCEAFCPQPILTPP